MGFIFTAKKLGISFCLLAVVNIVFIPCLGSAEEEIVCDEQKCTNVNEGELFSVEKVNKSYYLPGLFGLNAGMVSALGVAFLLLILASFSAYLIKFYCNEVSEISDCIPEFCKESPKTVNLKGSVSSISINLGDSVDFDKNIDNNVKELGKNEIFSFSDFSAKVGKGNVDKKQFAEIEVKNVDECESRVRKSPKTKKYAEDDGSVSGEKISNQQRRKRVLPLKLDSGKKVYKEDSQ